MSGDNRFSDNPEHWRKVKNRIVHRFRLKDRPILLGEVSIFMSLNLQRTTKLLEELVEEKWIRPMTAEELKSVPNSHEGYVFVLVDRNKVPPPDDW